MRVGSSFVWVMKEVRNSFMVLKLVLPIEEDSSTRKFTLWVLFDLMVTESIRYADLRHYRQLVFREIFFSSPDIRSNLLLRR